MAHEECLRPFGTGVIGGMLGATLIAIFFIPLFFALLERISERFFPPREKARRAKARPFPVAPGEKWKPSQKCI